MKITFDSNAWERVFAMDDREWSSIRDALLSGHFEGFISEISFRIEAVQKKLRVRYFAEPALGVQFPFSIVMKDGKPYVQIMSIGPEDRLHPGLPEAQSRKLNSAFAAGVRLLRGIAWLGLPGPAQSFDPSLFASSNDTERESRQILAATRIEERGVGRAAFTNAGGWNGAATDSKLFSKACAEWADGELVAAHIAYRNDVLCTDDHGRAARIASIFDLDGRNWLAAEFGVQFASLEQLRDRLARRMA
jgi:hypothetical protein